MTGRFLCSIVFLTFACFFCRGASSAEPIDVWPDLAPGETTRLIGDKLPGRPEEIPTVTRVVNVTRPTFTAHIAKEPNGTAVIILPGGGFGKVVPDKEGTEAAEWLNRYGVSAFVLTYRTSTDSQSPAWIKPLQDAQRLIKLIRSEANHWAIQPDRLGLLAFSAGGQVGARLLSDGGQLAYGRSDAIDDIPHRPDFALLIYPWNIYDSDTDSLVPGISVQPGCPPTFLVHTHDDRSSSLGTTLFYVGLKRHDIPAELHIYGNGGHGYGMRKVEGSQISTWPEHASHWLGTQGLLGESKK